MTEKQFSPEVAAAVQACNQKLQKVYYALLYLKAKRQKGQLSKDFFTRLYKWQTVLAELLENKLKRIPGDHPELLYLRAKFSLLTVSSELLLGEMEIALQAVDRLAKHVQAGKIVLSQELKAEQRLFESCKQLLMHQNSLLKSRPRV